MASPTEVTPVSFLETNQAWRDGELSTQEALRIPRIPEVVGTVPNPEAFSQTDMDNAPWASTDHIAYALEHGSAHPDSEEAFFEAYQPALDLISRHAASLGIRATNPDDLIVSFSVQQSRAHGLQEAHLDFVQNGRRKSQALYIVTDQHPTLFLSGSFEVPSPEEHTRAEVTSALEAQRPEAQVWAAEPYDIVAFDSTLPHAAPEMEDDPTPRTTLRLWFAEKIPAPILDS